MESPLLYDMSIHHLDYLRYLMGALDPAHASVAEVSCDEFSASWNWFKGHASCAIVLRFVSGAYSYAVFTRAKGEETIDAGVEVRNRDTGKTSTVSCSERPRFYIGELKGLLACDPETPAGEKCIE